VRLQPQRGFGNRDAGDIEASYEQRPSFQTHKIIALLASFDLSSGALEYHTLWKE
jgi:hypothetical protein